MSDNIVTFPIAPRVRPPTKVIPIRESSTTPIVTFPIAPRVRPPTKVIPIRESSTTPDAYRQETLAIVRREFEHAMKKLTVVAAFHNELPWAVRLIENALTDLKSHTESK